MNRAKTSAVWLIIFAFLVYAGWQAFQYIIDQQIPRVPLTVHGTSFQARVVSSPEARQKGLSGTSQLPRTEAMLFDFGSDDTWGIWMKDMNYPIDIVWLDKDKRIIYMVKQAEPSSYPYTSFKPSKPARYVIEFAEDTINGKDLTIGDKATFDISGLQEGETK